MDYKKILEGVVNIINTTEKSDIGFINICTYIGENCPELVEGEDEKIRKALVELISTYLREHENGKIHGVYAKDILAWLEKQGTPAELSEEEQNKFAKGVLTSCALSFIDYLDAQKYEGKMCVSNGECEDIENAFHNAMWDRLHRYYCKYIEKQGEQKSANLAKGEDYGIDGLYNAIRILEKTLGKVEGYQSDDGILEHECAISAVKKLYEQKSVWSEEDDEMVQVAINACNSYQDSLVRSDSRFDKAVKAEDWLKSLKERVQPQPKQEWSEEDKRSIRDSIFYLKSAKKYFEKDDDILWDEKWFNLCIEFLEALYKKLQPQTTWKPSKEQIGALEHFVRSIAESGFASPYDSNTKLVYSLFNDLKKLREE